MLLTWIPHPETVIKDHECELGCNCSRPFLQIKAGDKVAQGLLIPYIEQEWLEVNELPDADSDRTGGWGSTGETHAKI